MILDGEINNSKQWVDCLDYISRRLKKQSYNTWLKPTKGEPNGNGEFKIAVPNQFVADWIDSHFKNLIEEAFVEVLGDKKNIVYVLSEEDPNEEQTSLDLYEKPKNIQNHEVAQHAYGYNHNLNERYTFDSLVVGDFNQFACAASMAVAESPGMTKYNPLYIYGGTGLGKTHIIQAIGHNIRQKSPEKRVIYATSEKFTSDFIAAISDRTISDFTRMYRDVDVLVIDDIQFFTGKESTQEQFFHTFNTLYHFGKQIILSSDRPPKEIKGLEERLLSRFSWGLVTDIQPPDFEARTAILYKKLESEGLSLPENVITFIADNITTNIRDLEGALTRLIAFTSIHNTEINVDTASKVLSDAFTSRKKDITISRIQKKTAEKFQVDPDMMKAKKKTADVVLARQVAMYLSRTLTDYSLKIIGQEFGGRGPFHGYPRLRSGLEQDVG